MSLTLLCLYGCILGRSSEYCSKLEEYSLVVNGYHCLFVSNREILCEKRDLTIQKELLYQLK